MKIKLSIIVKIMLFGLLLFPYAVLAQDDTRQSEIEEKLRQKNKQMQFELQKKAKALERVLDRKYGTDWLHIIGEELPDDLKRIQEAKERNVSYDQAVEAYERALQLMELKKKNLIQFQESKEQQKLNLECQKLAQEYQTIKDKKKQATIKKELEKKLNKLFDLREEARLKKVEALEQEMEKLKQMVDFRKKNKAKIIERRLNELLGNEDQLAW